MPVFQPPAVKYLSLRRYCGRLKIPPSPKMSDLTLGQAEKEGMTRVIPITSNFKCNGYSTLMTTVFLGVGLARQFAFGGYGLPWGGAWGE